MQGTRILSQWSVKHDAHFTCMYSVYYIGTRVYSPGYYTADTNVLRMDNVLCTGSEAKLKECDFDIETVALNTAVGMECQYSE